MAPRQQNARSARALESRRTRGIQSYRCRVCRGIHPLRKCARFLKLSAEKRLRAVLINKYCANCLAHEHSTGDCRSGDRCKKCDRSHHTLLHMHEQVSSVSGCERARVSNRCQPGKQLRPRPNVPAGTIRQLSVGVHRHDDRNRRRQAHRSRRCCNATA